MFGLPAICYAKGFLFTFLGFAGMLAIAILLGSAIVGAILGITWVLNKLRPIGFGIRSPMDSIDSDKVLKWVMIIVGIGGYIYMSLLMAQGICQ